MGIEAKATVFGLPPGHGTFSPEGPSQGFGSSVMRVVARSSARWITESRNGGFGAGSPRRRAAWASTARPSWPQSFRLTLPARQDGGGHAPGAEARRQTRRDGGAYRWCPRGGQVRAAASGGDAQACRRGPCGAPRGTHAHGLAVDLHPGQRTDDAGRVSLTRRHYSGRIPRRPRPDGADDRGPLTRSATSAGARHCGPGRRIRRASAAGSR